MVELGVNSHEITIAVLIDEPITGTSLSFPYFGLACDGRFGCREEDFAKCLVRFFRGEIRQTYLTAQQAPKGAPLNTNPKSTVFFSFFNLISGK